MRFVIDGYNLIFRALETKEESLEKQRDQVIPFLWGLFEGTKHRVEIIFDSNPKYFFSLNTHRDPPFHLLFSPPQMSADAFIMEICHGSKKRDLTIVSSDKHLLLSVKELEIPTLTVEDFLSLFRFKKKKKGHSEKPVIEHSTEKLARYRDIFEKRADDPMLFEDL